jgi:hypothetical protein
VQSGDVVMSRTNSGLSPHLPGATTPSAEPEKTCMNRGTSRILAGVLGWEPSTWTPSMADQMVRIAAARCRRPSFLGQKNPLIL